MCQHCVQHQNKYEKKEGKREKKGLLSVTSICETLPLLPTAELQSYAFILLSPASQAVGHPFKPRPPRRSALSSMGFVCSVPSALAGCRWGHWEKTQPLLSLQGLGDTA